MEEILAYMEEYGPFINDEHKARELSTRFLLPYSMAKALIGVPDRKVVTRPVDSVVVDRWDWWEDKA